METVIGRRHHTRVGSIVVISVHTLYPRALTISSPTY